VATLHHELTLLEALRSARERPDSMALDDLLLRGRAARMRGPTPENISEALTLYKQAMRLAPDSAWAASGLAASYVISVIQYQSQAPEQDMEQARTLIARALSGNPRCFFCWFVNGLILRTGGHFSEALAAFQRSFEINPNYPHAYAHLGITLIYLGRAHETAAYIERAMRLSPRDNLVPLWQTLIGRAELLLGNDARAVEILRQSASGNPRFAGLDRPLAAGLVLTGDLDGARQAALTFRSLTPGISPVPYEEAFATDPTYRAQRARVAQALRAVRFDPE
jgi:tetratricopeptide (TPR) repeat protein